MFWACSGYKAGSGLSAAQHSRMLFAASYPAAPRFACFAGTRDARQPRTTRIARGPSRPFAFFRTRINACYAYRAATGPHFVPGLPQVTLIELRQALISYQDYHILLLTLAGRGTGASNSAGGPAVWRGEAAVRERNSGAGARGRRRRCFRRRAQGRRRPDDGLRGRHPMGAQRTATGGPPARPPTISRLGPRRAHSLTPPVTHSRPTPCSGGKST